MSGDVVQGLGRQILLGIHMLSKSVKMYTTDNAVFAKPLQDLLNNINKVISLEHRIDFALVGPALYLNDRLIRADHTSQEALKTLAHSFRVRHIGGFTVVGAATVDDLRNFFHIFTVDGAGEVPEDGLPGHKLRGMQLKRWSAHQEKAQRDFEAGDENRRFFASYANAIVWARYQARCVRDGRRDDAARVSFRIAQDLVDVSVEYGARLLSMLRNGEGDDAIPFHVVNSAFLAIAFGTQLGLPKIQLKDLAVSALNNETVLPRLPPSLWFPADPGKLTADQIAQRRDAWQTAARSALASRANSRVNQVRALSAVEMHEPYLVSTKDASGKIVPKVNGDPLLTSRILAIANHYDVLTTPSGDRQALAPDAALGAMWGALRYWFDPELLWVFVRAMARTPFKVFPREQGGIIDAAPQPGGTPAR